MSHISRTLINHADPLGAAIIHGPDNPLTTAGGMNAANGTLVTTSGGLAFVKYGAGATDWRALGELVFDVRSYGAVGDYTSRPLSTIFATLGAAQAVYPSATSLTNELDGVAIQKAITAAQAARTAGVTTGAAVWLPYGTYLSNMPITVVANYGIMIRGDGIKQTALICTAVMPKFLILGDAVAQLPDMTMMDLTVDGGALRPGGGSPLANYAIYGSRVDNSTFVRVKASGALVANCSLGYGYTNKCTDCRWSNGSGDGFLANEDYAQSNNAISFVNCLSISNAGFGYRLRAGLGVSFFGGNVEQNAKGGIFVTRQITGLSGIGTYFEQNGAAGYTISGTLIKAHILLNGNTSETVASGVYPSAGVNLSGNFVSSGGYETAFVWAAGVNGLLLGQNGATIAAGSAIPLLRVVADPALALVANVELAGNIGFATQPISVASIPAANTTTFRNWRSTAVPQQNYAEPDFLRWILIAGNTGGTFQRSASTYRKQPVWEIDGATASGTSHVYGFSIDLALYPELQGQVVYCGFWARQSATGFEINAYANGNRSSAAATNTNTSWRWIEAAVLLGTSGTVNFGIFCETLGAGKVARFTEPTLAVVGVAADDLYKLPAQRVWYGTGVPTVGTWEAGDRVESRTPAVGAPKGWRCTVGGAPGTWVSEGNL